MPNTLCCIRRYERRPPAPSHELNGLLASNVGGYTKKSIANTILFMRYSVSNIVFPQPCLSRAAPQIYDDAAVQPQRLSFVLVFSLNF